MCVHSTTMSKTFELKCSPRLSHSWRFDAFWRRARFKFSCREDRLEFTIERLYESRHKWWSKWAHAYGVFIIWKRTHSMRKTIVEQWITWEKKLPKHSKPWPEYFFFFAVFCFVIYLTKITKDKISFLLVFQNGRTSPTERRHCFASLLGVPLSPYEFSSPNRRHILGFFQPAPSAG